MNLDDPKITAYALGEVGEEILLDGEAAKIVEETVLVAGILRRHLRRRRRKFHLMRYAVAACLVMAGMWIVSSRTTSREMVASVKMVAPVAEKEKVGEPILHLTPLLADADVGSCLAKAEFKGDRARDVQELVEAVLQDASRVGSFRSLRLMPEELVVVQ